MSRSYKHTPRCGNRKGRYSKHLANHVVRRNRYKDAFPQYAGYKKMFESWNICDYEIVGRTFEQYYAHMVTCWYIWERHFGKPFPDREQSREEYQRWYIRK